MNDVTLQPEQIALDTESDIRALTNQRNSALDAVAQLEGLVGTLRKEIAELKKPKQDAPAVAGT